MINSIFYRTSLKTSAASLVLSIGLLSGAAFGQTATETARASAAEAVEDEEIVVTGSLIRSPNLVLSSPVNATTADEIAIAQNNNAEGLLREIPGVVPGIGSSGVIANSGSSFVNLRGLGDNRNIVLLDGARVVAADMEGRFDLNNVPLALVERVDVLTGGASTTYGADAISGVVNFITNSRFTGLRLDASGQVTQQGDGGTVRVDLTGGTSFGGERGHLVLSGGYQKGEPVYQHDRSFSATPISAITGRVAGSGISTPASFSLPGVGTRQVRRDALVPFYAPYNGNVNSLFQTGFERYNLFGSLQYEISDAIEVYARGIYSRNTVDVFAAYGGAFTTPVQINLSNPFLTATQRSQFCSANGIDVASCNAAALATNPNDPAYRTVNSVMSRRVEALGDRNNETKTDFYDLRLGLRGAVTDSLRWDIYGTYGESDRETGHHGYGVAPLIAQSMLAVAGPGGAPVCINTANNCVPINWFGPAGSITEAQAKTISRSWFEGQRASLLQFNGTLSGDLGWSLPWASNPMSFAIGGVYRKHEASQFADALSESGEVSGGPGPIIPFGGGYSVYEAVGEVSLPVIRERPFFHELTLEGGIRYSHYKIDAPDNPSYSTTTWKAGGGWAPVEGIRFRGTYAHSVRSPNIAELFEPQFRFIGSLADDPCANIDDQGAAIPGRPAPTGTLREVCLAQGAPANQIGFIQVPIAREVNTTIGGNLEVGPEKSNSYTIGVVLSPSQIPKLTMSVDYYNIKITDAISAPTPADAISACFDRLSVSNPSCQVIERDPLTGSLRGSPQVGGLFLGLSNLGRLATDGIDVSINYQHDLGFADWSINATGNWTNKSVFQATPTGEIRDCVGVYNTSCNSLQPEFQWTVRNTLSTDRFDVSLLWRHIDSMRSTVPLYSGPVPQLGSGNFDFNRMAAYDIFDVTGRFRVNDSFAFTIVVENLFDKEPPLVGTPAGPFGFNYGNTYPSTYDVLGRRFILTATASF